MSWNYLTISDYFILLPFTCVFVYRLYQAGFDPKVSNLYGDVSFPVPRGTPSVSSLLGWDHSTNRMVPSGTDFFDPGSKEFKYEVSLADVPENPDQFLHGHKMDGRLIYPSMGKLQCPHITIIIS